MNLENWASWTRRSSFYLSLPTRKINVRRLFGDQLLFDGKIEINSKKLRWSPRFLSSTQFDPGCGLTIHAVPFPSCEWRFLVNTFFSIPSTIRKQVPSVDHHTLSGLLCDVLATAKRWPNRYSSTILVGLTVVCFRKRAAFLSTMREQAPRAEESLLSLIKHDECSVEMGMALCSIAASSQTPETVRWSALVVILNRVWRQQRDSYFVLQKQEIVLGHNKSLGV